MKSVSVVLCAVATMCSGAAQAFIPAVPLPEVGWAGPGHICESSFTLRVKQGEFVREDIQLEPSQPTSNTIKSEAGWFTVATLTIRPSRPILRSRVHSDKAGDLYEVPPDDPYSFEKAYLFLPSKPRAPAVEISFFKVTASPSDPDWRRMPQRSFSQSAYAEVLARIAFRKDAPSDCLNPPR